MNPFTIHSVFFWSSKCADLSFALLEPLVKESFLPPPGGFLPITQFLRMQPKQLFLGLKDLEFLKMCDKFLPY